MEMNKVTNKEKHIINLLIERNSPMTAREITEVLNPGSHQSVVFGYLNDMYKQGLLVKEMNNTKKVYEFYINNVNNKTITSTTYVKQANKRADKIIDREEKLRSEFNEFWSDIFSIRDDYYSKIPTEKLLKLKIAVSNINNILTYKATISLALVINDSLKISDYESEEIIRNISNTNSNANGYDIEFNGSKPYIAEVKCNIPINNSDKFGSKQLEGITNDIKALLNGKSKSRIEDTSNYYKFIGIYKFNTKTVIAVNNLISNLSYNLRNKVQIWNSETQLDKNKVYIQLISL